MELPQTYEAKEAEKRWNTYWDQHKVYVFDAHSKKPIFSLDTPPPTVSGAMHLGHSFSYSQMDFIARYKRMRGFNVFYPFGTDDNGLPTERLVEKLKNVKGTRMGRQEFIKLCEATLAEIRPNFVQDWKDIGISCDWNLFYSTINDHCRRISQRSFIELYKKGRIYQKEAPTIWCPQCQTAIAQVELEDVEFPSSFNDIVFKVEENDLIVATTRPEMLGSCVAVFAHPEDVRYQKYFGKKATVPLFHHEVPIMADERADPEKGTGIVMCCTFGDQTDIQWYKAHNLPLVVSIAKDGKMTEKAGPYVGLSIKDARKKIIEDLKASGLLVSQKSIVHAVNVHERCGTEIEILNSKQWFVKYLDLKDDFLARGKELRWFPDHMHHRFDNWVKGLQWDWCISRQRFFGVPFPIWYKKDGTVVVADEKQLPVDPLRDKPAGHENEELTPEKDVFDTWATSSLTPQLAIELVKGTPAYNNLFPMSLRPQAHDIISFWLFNTVVKSHLHANSLPWKDVMISGWALDPKGKKMSKSKGNVVEPQPMREKYGADALRFWAAGSRLGDDLPFQEKDLVTGKKMVTKIFNAAKFALMHLEGYDGHFDTTHLLPIDRWILSKLHKIVKESTETFDRYEYNRTKLEVEKFFWGIFCDNYLEIIKDRMYNTQLYTAEQRKAAQFTLEMVLGTVIKLLAPIMPFVTEEVYQMYFAKKENSLSIHVSSWPTYDETFFDDKAEQAGDVLVDILSAARKAKSQKNASLKTEIKLLTIGATDEQKQLLEPLLQDLKSASCTKEILFAVASGDAKTEVHQIPVSVDLALATAAK